MKTIVLGGYGNFGARIRRALASCPEIELVVAGRNERQAINFATSLSQMNERQVDAFGIDVAKDDLTAALRHCGVELVIHTAGPFQQQDYRVPFATAAANAHYIDLADSRRFVCDFSHTLTPAFDRAKRLAISGASTVPALSSAVINDLTTHWQRIDAIEFCIAPAHTAPRGIATLAGVLDYCGAPIQIWKNHQWIIQYGWAAPQHVTFTHLQPRLGALCDIPDLELFPAYYPDVHSVMFRAALEVRFAQRMLALLATLRRYGLIKQPARWAAFLNRAAKTLDFLGTSLGGMMVCVKGINADGKPIDRIWNIAADNDHGPEIPCMATILLARRLARQEISRTGAHACMGWLKLVEFQPEFLKWNMITDTMDRTGS